MQLKEPFTSLDDWIVTKGSASIVSGEFVNTGEGRTHIVQAMMQPINLQSTFRLDVRFKVNASTPTLTTGQYYGLTRKQATDSEVISDCIYLCLRGSVGGKAYLYLFGDWHEVYDTALTAGNYYRFQLACDGTTLTATIMDDNQQILGTVKIAAPNIIIYNYSIAHDVGASTGSLDFVGFYDALDGYNDEIYNQILSFYRFIGGTAEDNRCLIQLPANYQKSVKNKLVIYCHGAGKNAEAIYDASVADAISTLVANGYMIASGQNYGNNWGSTPATNHVRQIRDYLYDNFNTYFKTILMCSSMGGLTSTLFAARFKAYVAGLVLIFPVLNLDWVYHALYSTVDYSAEINTAYGCTAINYPYKTLGHSPHDRILEFLDLPISIWHGDSDVNIPIKHSQDFVTNIVANGGSATLTTVVGGTHSDPDVSPPADVLSFVESVTDYDAPILRHYVLNQGISLIS